MKPFISIFLFLAPLSALSQSGVGVSEHFRQVDQTLWIVADLDKVIEEWAKLGFTQVTDLGEVKAKFKSSGNWRALRMARANLGGALVTWIQPLAGQSIFSTFQQGYGEGAMSLVHRFADRKALQNEIRRLAGLGVEIRDEVAIETGKGKWNYVLMNTAAEGKYVLGYVYGDDDRKISASLSDDNRHGLKMTQYAFAARQAEPAASFWEQVGLPRMEITHGPIRDKQFAGQPADFDMNLGWQRHGKIVYEWCLPLKSPTVYETHMEKHGEGIQHFGFNTTQIDEVIQDFQSRGFAVSMSGAWGEKDKAGSGRFAYIDLESAGGLTIELLWNYRAP